MDFSTIATSNFAKALSLAGRKRQKIKSLSGFDKRFRMPDGDEDSRLKYLARIAADDIGRDLDDVFEKLRSIFGFKRRELVVTGPVDGSGSIETPSFVYRVEVFPDPAGNDNLIWQHVVTEISQPEILFSESFQNAFGSTMGILQVELTSPLDISSIIDHVEDLAGDGCQVEYDRQATWCEIKTDGSAATMRIDADRISVKGPSQMPLAELFQSWWQLQQRFLETIQQ